MSKINPSFYLEKLFDLNIEKVKLLGFKHLLIDFDNTIIPFNQKKLDEKVHRFLDKLKNNDLDLIIVSNNSKKRLKLALQDEFKFVYRCLKPFTNRINKYLIKNNIDKDKCLFIGDQLFSDILCANKLNIKSILVEPLTKDDLLITKLNRYKDKKKRKKIINDIERF